MDFTLGYALVTICAIACGHGTIREIQKSTHKQKPEIEIVGYVKSEKEWRKIRKIERISARQVRKFKRSLK